MSNLSAQSSFHPFVRLAGRSVGLLILVLVAYAPAWPGSFLWDDDSALLENPHIRADDGWSRIWFSDESLEYYPLFYSSLRIQWACFGADPTGYLFVNAVLHAVNALLLGVLLRCLSSLFRWPGKSLAWTWWAALLFAVHPVAVHAVAWINQHKTILSTTFYFVSLVLYFRSRERVGSGGRMPKGYGVLAWFFFVAGLLTKPTLALMPVFLLVVECLANPSAWRRAGLRLVPWFAVAVAFSMLRIWWDPPPVLNEIMPTRAGSGWLPWALAGWSSWFSLWKIILPLNLAMIYPRWPIETWTMGSLVPLVVLFVTIGGVWSVRKTYSGLVMALCSFVVVMVPVSGLFDNTYFAFSHVANHWMYPALPGVVAVMAYTLVRWTRRLPQLAIAIPLTLVILWTVWSRGESSRYRDPTDYYSRGVADNPDNIIAHHNLANLLVERGQPDQALTHYLEATRIHPVFWQAQVGAGKLLTERGDYKEAFDHFNLAHAYFPDQPVIQFYLGLLYGYAGLPEEAQRHFRRAVELNRLDPVAWYNLGAALLQTGEQDAARLALEEALRLHPDYRIARELLNRVAQRAPEGD